MTPEEESIALIGIWEEDGVMKDGLVDMNHLEDALADHIQAARVDAKAAALLAIMTVAGPEPHPNVVKRIIAAINALE